MHLIRESLWDYVDSTEAKPKVTDVEKLALKAWKDKAEKAVATIFPFLESSTQQLLGEVVDPTVLWANIRALHKIHCFSATFVVWKRLLGTKAEDKIQGYVAKIQ